MPKKYRLSGDEIRDLSGKRSHGRLFSMLIAPIDGAHAKCAVVVSKKIAVRAVDRNKIKRRVRSALKKRMRGVQKPVALVLYAKREAKDAKFADVSHDIESLFSKL